MNLSAHPELIRPVVAERHEALRRQAVLARLQREARAEAKSQRRLRRARRRLRRPQLVAPPPALAD